MWVRELLCAAALACGLAVPVIVIAEEAAPGARPAVNNGAFGIAGGVDYATSYFFRGYNQEDIGAIVQPYATLTWKLAETDSFTLSYYLGTWNSLHSEQTLKVSGPAVWYESDFYTGVDISFGPITLGAIYTAYMYPNGSFGTIQEVGFKATFDDTELWKKANVPVAFKPYAAWYFEVQDSNGPTDQYIEVGVAPSFAIPNVPLALSVPMALGLSPDGYYIDSSGHNDFFGYASIGLTASYTLPVPAKFGSWSIVGGVQYIYLFADSAQNANDGGTNDELLGKVGLAFSY